MSTIHNIITRQLVAEDQRTHVTADLFGVYFPLQLEPFIFSMASRLSEDYGGGYWLFYTLNNGGFYMAPDSDGRFQVTSENGWEGFMSPTPSGSPSACSPTATCRSARASLPRPAPSNITCYAST